MREQALGRSGFWRLSFLAAIVLSCLFGHILGPFGGGRHRFAPPSSVDLMRGAREHKELLLGALERIEHHTHGAGNNRLQDAFFPSLCWGKCLGADVTDATMSCRCALSCWSSRGQRRSLPACMRASQRDFLAQGAAFRLDQRHVWTAVATASPVWSVVIVPSPFSCWERLVWSQRSSRHRLQPRRKPEGSWDSVICGLLRTYGSLRRSIVMLPLQGAERPQP